MTVSTLINRARMTVSGTPGTGAITLGSASTSFQSFASAGILNGQSVSYVIEDGANWEIGQGVYTTSGTALARTTILGSSSGGAAITATSAAIVSATALASDVQAIGPVGGRLTLSSQPAMGTGVSNSTLVAYYPYNGDRAPFWNGRDWQWQQFAAISNILSDATTNPAACAASSVYDLFLWRNAGVWALSRGPAWTNTTTRSAGTAIAIVNGFYANSVSITNGPAAGFGLYVGTFATNASATVDMIFGASGSGGGVCSLSVWNNFNRVDTIASNNDNGAGYPYATATWRQARASALNQINFVIGLLEEPVTAFYSTSVTTAATAGSQASIGIGLNSTSGPQQPIAQIYTVAAAALSAAPSVTVPIWTAGACVTGVNMIAALENGTSGSTAFDAPGLARLQLLARM